MNPTNEHQAIAAREAANKIRVWESKIERDAAAQIILAAIEKAHQDGWYEGRDYEIKLRSEPVAQPHPPIPTAAETAGDEQWTEDRVEQCLENHGAKGLAQVINAALAAKVEGSREWEYGYQRGKLDTSIELAAEREKRKQLEIVSQKRYDDIVAQMRDIKPLVDALENIKDYCSGRTVSQCRSIALDALAKVK